MEKSNRKINGKIHVYCFIIKVSQNNNNNNNKLSVSNTSSINKTIYYYNSKKENELKTNKRKQRPDPVIRVNIMVFLLSAFKTANIYFYS